MTTIAHAVHERVVAREINGFSVDFKSGHMKIGMMLCEINAEEPETAIEIKDIVGA